MVAAKLYVRNVQERNVIAGILARKTARSWIPERMRPIKGYFLYAGLAEYKRIHLLSSQLLKRAHLAGGEHQPVRQEKRRACRSFPPSSAGIEYDREAALG
jgi:hypothetical protein